MSKRLRVEIEIVNKLGLHARPAMEFVDTASRFRCDVWLSKDGQTVNARSIMEIMMLAATQGSVLILEAEGGDADECVDALRTLVADGFGEH